MNKLRRVIFTAAVLSLAARAEATLFNSRGVTITTENDKFFAGTDRHYTNGLKISFLGTTTLDESPEFVQTVSRLIPTLRDEATHQAYKVGTALGHDIYTPAHIGTSELQRQDRPYAGWLYLSLNFQAVDKEQRLLRAVEVSAGVVGPSAFGEEIQNGFHELIDVGAAQGWSNQLRNEPGVIVAWERRYRLLRLQMDAAGRWACDAIARGHVSLGNVRTHGAGGLMVRTGWNLPRDFGPDLIRATGGDQHKVERAGAYIFASGEGRVVGHNIFLDGNTWKDSHSVDKRPFVADLNVGLVMRTPLGGGSESRGFQIAYIQNYRTKEFYGQTRRDVFGSVSVSVLY